MCVCVFVCVCVCVCVVAKCSQIASSPIEAHGSTLQRSTHTRMSCSQSGSENYVRLNNITEEAKGVAPLGKGVYVNKIFAY